MTRISTRTLAAMVLSTFSISAFAVPARPGAFIRTQPDGSEITVTLHGDEHFHYLQDKEGYIIGQQPDGWYRILDNQGQATTLVPMDYNMRSTSEQSALMQIRPEMTFEALKSRALNTGRLNVNKAPAMYRAGSVSASKWDNSDGHDLRAIPTDGERHVLVVLVNFSDLKWSFADDPQKEMNAILNQPGYTGNHCTGSAADYFRQSSNGVYQPIFDVYGPVTLDKPCKYYGGNDSSGDDSAPWEMVSDACRMLDSQVDFSIYDTNGDGYVDNVYVFYAGYGENEGAGDNYVWPHAFNLRYVMNPPELDGVVIDHYACSNELMFRPIANDKKSMSGIGTFCHEFSHVLGIPDLYATSYSNAFTPGNYSIMDHGSYNNDARTPPLYSIYEKYALEWEKPIEITSGADINMQPTVDQGLAYKITIDPSRPTEYYLFENRQQHDWDTYIPGHGMLVWHVDFDKSIWDSNIVNNNAQHQYLDIVEADGTADSGSQAGDTFPGTSNRAEFRGTATAPYPSFANWNGKATSLDITNIGEDATGTISFKVGDGGSADSELHINAPKAILTGVDTNALTFQWEPVANAKAYYITVLSMKYDELFGALETALLEDYTFTNIGTDTRITLENLEPGMSYQVSLYAATDKNLSAPSQGFFTTFSDNMEQLKPMMSITPGDNYADLKWYDVPDADHYEITVATRTEGTPELGANVNWDNRKYPDSWSFPGGIFDTRDEYFGASSPSLRLTNGTAITTGKYTKDISSISFWARTNIANADLSVKIYSVDENYSISEIAEVTGIPCSSSGATMEVKDLPSGVRQLMLQFSCRTAGLTLNIDDINIYYAGDITDIPVAGYDAYQVSGTSLKVEGLAPQSEYVAYMRAIDSAGNKSALSQILKFATTAPGGIGDASVSNAFYMSNGVVTSTQPVDIYRIDGTPVALKAIGAIQLPYKGIYVISCNGKASKVVW